MTIFKGARAKGFGGFKRLNIRTLRYNKQIEGFASQIGSGRKESIRLAVKHLTLIESYPAISLPESVLYDWLVQRGIPFVYQAVTSVDSTPDFFIIPTGVAVLINGEYFHQMPGARGEDLREVQALPGTFTDGMLIRSAVRLWEGDCLSEHRQLYFDKTIQGVEIRSIYNRGERGG